MYFCIGASKSNLFSDNSFISAAEVTAFDTLLMRKRVLGVTGSLFSTSANPNPRDSFILPFMLTQSCKPFTFDSPKKLLQSSMAAHAALLSWQGFSGAIVETAWEAGGWLLTVTVAAKVPRTFSHLSKLVFRVKQLYNLLAASPGAIPINVPGKSIPLIPIRCRTCFLPSKTTVSMRNRSGCFLIKSW